MKLKAEPSESSSIDSSNDLEYLPKDCDSLSIRICCIPLSIGIAYRYIRLLHDPR